MFGAHCPFNPLFQLAESKVDTTRFNESVQWCRSAWDFESKKSELLAQFVCGLTVFIFIWGGLETVIKIIAPSGFDYEEAKRIGRKGDMIDRAIFFLKNKIASQNCVPLYDDMLTHLRLMIKKHPEYSEFGALFKEDAITNISGIGIHIVSLIRNSFAHGSAQLPFPENWGEQGFKFSETELTNLNLIETSSRIILLTIQMLLQAYFRDQHFKINIFKIF